MKPPRSPSLSLPAGDKKMSWLNASWSPASTVAADSTPGSPVGSVAPRSPAASFFDGAQIEVDAVEDEYSVVNIQPPGSRSSQCVTQSMSAHALFAQWRNRFATERACQQIVHSPGGEVAAKAPPSPVSPEAVVQRKTYLHRQKLAAFDCMYPGRMQDNHGYQSDQAVTGRMHDVRQGGTSRPTGTPQTVVRREVPQSSGGGYNGLDGQRVVNEYRRASLEAGREVDRALAQCRADPSAQPARRNAAADMPRRPSSRNGRR